MRNSHRICLRHFLLCAYELGVSDKSSTLLREGLQHLAEAHSLSFCLFQQNLLDTTGILDRFLRPIYYAVWQVQSSGEPSQNIFSNYISIYQIHSERCRQLQCVFDKGEICEGGTKF